MELKDVIEARRSIRQFKTDPISREEINQIIELGLKAPSGKNQQPWKIFALDGEIKHTLTQLMRSEVEKAIEQANPVKHVLFTISAMEDCSTVLLIYNDKGRELQYMNIPEKYISLSHIQSIGAMIQTMILAAEDKGYGSLWICDIFLAEDVINNWIGSDLQIVAAIAIGVKNENPGPRPRKSIEDVVSWL